MKKIINGKLYNTETSILIATSTNGFSSRDFAYYSEDLYKTTKGTYFLYKEGGPMSCIAYHVGNTIHGNEDIELLSIEEAKDFLTSNNLVNAYTEEFGEIEEG